MDGVLVLRQTTEKIESGVSACEVLVNGSDSACRATGHFLYNLNKEEPWVQVGIEKHVWQLVSESRYISMHRIWPVWPALDTLGWQPNIHH